MQFIQILQAPDIMEARQQYLSLLDRERVPLAPSTEVYVETIHRPDPTRQDSWLCYLALPRDRAA